MARLTAEKREAKFSAMRERTRWLQEAQEARLSGAAPPPKPLSQQAGRRREKMNSVPAHLQMYRVQEVASMLGVSRQTVHHWFEARAVKVFGPGGAHRRKATLLISRQALEDWIREHT